MSRDVVEDGARSTGGAKSYHEQHYYYFETVKRMIPRSSLAQTFVAVLAIVGLVSASPLLRMAYGDGVPEAVRRAEAARIAAVAKAKVSAVSVFAKGGQGGGSGVVITPDGYALTNYHVARPAGSAMQCSMPDGKMYDAVLVGVDPVGDVALIKLIGRDDFPAAELGDSDSVRAGDWCFAIGNPFLLATDLQPTVTYGIVSGVHRYQYPAGTLLEYADCIQTDAAINPGNSGGPLFDAEGRLIGINGRGSFEKRGRVNVGVGYAISINQIKKFMGYLRSGRIVDHATLGATVATSNDGTVRVADILESSDAFRRGLRYDDEILSFAGRRVPSVNIFKNILGTLPKGWRVPLTYRRDSESKTIYVRLQGVHAGDELLKKLEGGRPPRKTKEKKPGEEPEPKPKKPASPHEAKKAAIPKHLAKFIKKRRGFGNYYFNEWNRDRVWKAFRPSGNPLATGGAWSMTGIQDGMGDVEIEWTEKQVTGKFPQGRFVVDFEKDLDSQLGPAGSGGFLTALTLWRRLLTIGPKTFGELYYLGTSPVVGREGLFDTLVGTYRTVDVRFYFDPANGQLVLLELYPGQHVDPCEVYFDDYRDVNGVQMPHQMEVRYGNGIFGDFKWKQITMEDSRTAARGARNPVVASGN